MMIPEQLGMAWLALVVGAFLFVVFSPVGEQQWTWVRIVGGFASSAVCFLIWAAAMVRFIFQGGPHDVR